jgi:hypothetical protein
MEGEKDTRSSSVSPALAELQGKRGGRDEKVEY